LQLWGSLYTPKSKQHQLEVAVEVAEATQQFLALDNGKICVSVRLQGGGINSVAPSGRQELNPLTAGAGHFICCDRWGPASKSEQANGMTWHGEASKCRWAVVSTTATEAEVSVVLPMAGLVVTRRLQLQLDQPIVKVEEDITNMNALGRVWNVVQHPTLGPPFLDEQTVAAGRKASGVRGVHETPNRPPPNLPLSYFLVNFCDLYTARLAEKTPRPGGGLQRNHRLRASAACLSGRGQRAPSCRRSRPRVF
jgi:hypothetical protein